MGLKKNSAPATEGEENLTAAQKAAKTKAAKKAEAPPEAPTEKPKAAKATKAAPAPAKDKATKPTKATAKAAPPAEEPEATEAAEGDSAEAESAATVGKADLVESMRAHVAEQSMAIPPHLAKVAYDGFLSAIASALAEGKAVRTEIGKFTVSLSEARIGRNPKTGDEVEIAARNVVKFKPSASLKEVVNG